MTDRVVSVRIPAPLVLGLKKRIEKEHFKDLSELVRTIVRRRFLGFQLPAAQAAPSVPSVPPGAATAREFGALGKEQLISELEKLIAMLRK